MSLFIQTNNGTINHIENSTVTINAGMQNGLRVDTKPQVDAEDIEPDAEQESRRRGPKRLSLFRDAHDRKDELRTRTESERVRKYISEHHLGGKMSELDSSTTTKINKVAATFWQHWNERGWVSRVFEGAAFYRFITEDCGLVCGVEEKPFSRAMRQIIDSGKRDPEIYDYVAELF